MTYWQIIISILFPSGGVIDPAPELDRRIADMEYQMALAEMADDRYYTNGRRRRDLDQLNALKAERRRFTAK